MKIKYYFYSQEIFELEYNSEKQCYKTIVGTVDIDKYYASENYISHNDSSKSLVDRLYQWVKQRAIKNKWKLIFRNHSNTKQVLDFGCGTGDFLRYGFEQGVTVFGVEPNEMARKLACEKGIKVFKNLEQLPQQSFDVITLWHVLEHIPNYENLVLQLKKLLKPNGLLIIAVPNFKSYDAKHYKEFWAAWDVPRHFWHFSKKSIFQLAQDTSLSIKNIFPMYFDAFYIALISEKYKKSLLALPKGFIFGLFSNISGIFTKEYSSQIYILRKDT